MIPRPRPRRELGRFCAAEGPSVRVRPAGGSFPLPRSRTRPLGPRARVSDTPPVICTPTARARAYIPPYPPPKTWKCVDRASSESWTDPVTCRLCRFLCRFGASRQVWMRLSARSDCAGFWTWTRCTESRSRGVEALDLRPDPVGLRSRRPGRASARIVPVGVPVLAALRRSRDPNVTSGQAVEVHLSPPAGDCAGFCAGLSVTDCKS
jgi:hypothetical protein